MGENPIIARWAMRWAGWWAGPMRRGPGTCSCARARAHSSARASDARRRAACAARAACGACGACGVRARQHLRSPSESHSSLFRAEHARFLSRSLLGGHSLMAGPRRGALARTRATPASSASASTRFPQTRERARFSRCRLTGGRPRVVARRASAAARRRRVGARRGARRRRGFALDRRRALE